MLILLVPVRNTVLHQYYIHAAEDTPSLIGKVIRLEPTRRKRGKGYRALVEIEYGGEIYNVTTAGFNFTCAMYREAIETGLVPVYLNPEKPEKSVLSKGVPFLQHFCTGLFAAIGLFLLAAGCYCRKRARQTH